MISSTKKVYKSEICNTIFQKTKIKKKYINVIYDEIFKEIKNQLLKEKKLTIKNFASLKIKKYNNSFFKNCLSLRIKKSCNGWKNEK
ncbi:HU family DNA-binding protein [Spiroplasma floricola]|uniref:Uncharacterized protein n=1 Tax=Spiroplasma floricola 23-6 TaxID=1336749 RepID=A0A2K8SCT2_9MOLU|nr:HU family DNA-binding protein [Spiroplasma floricola]AUB31277.1 hypothetical protein SFLOR_v1c02160 [Spiroplasma floricola 23-6]